MKLLNISKSQGGGDQDIKKFTFFVSSPAYLWAGTFCAFYTLSALATLLFQ